LEQNNCIAIQNFDHSSRCLQPPPVDYSRFGEVAGSGIAVQSALGSVRRLDVDFDGSSSSPSKTTDPSPRSAVSGSSTDVDDAFSEMIF